jgi:phage shock protein A
MRGFIDWLMGDRAGRVIVGSWRWLWGLPVESGGKVAVAVAEESLQSMQESVQESVQQLAKAVAQQVGADDRARNKDQA